MPGVAPMNVERAHLDRALWRFGTMLWIAARGMPAAPRSKPTPPPPAVATACIWCERCPAVLRTPQILDSDWDWVSSERDWCRGCFARMLFRLRWWRGVSNFRPRRDKSADEVIAELDLASRGSSR